MSGSVNKVILVDEYINGLSLPQVAAKYGLSVSTARYHVKKAGALRSRTDAVRIAARDGRLGSGFRGKSRKLTDEHCQNIRSARLAWGEKNAAGTSVKPNGYLEYTRGPHKGRSVHVVEMEKRLGRPLKNDEHVHHIDGDKLNNDDSNLALVTRSGHARLHRLQDQMCGVDRERKADGRFR